MVSTYCSWSSFASSRVSYSRAAGSTQFDSATSASRWIYTVDTDVCQASTYMHTSRLVVDFAGARVPDGFASYLLEGVLRDVHVEALFRDGEGLVALLHNPNEVLQTEKTRRSARHGGAECLELWVTWRAVCSGSCSAISLRIYSIHEWMGSRNATAHPADQRTNAVGRAKGAWHAPSQRRHHRCRSPARPSASARPA